MLNRLASVSFAALALLLIQVAAVSGSPVVNSGMNALYVTSTLSLTLLRSFKI